MLVTLFYGTILVLLHAAKIAGDVIFDVVRFFQSVSSSSGSSANNSDQATWKFTKLPKHVAVVFADGNDQLVAEAVEPFVRTLFRVLDQCCQTSTDETGHYVVTLYDRRGYIKRNKHILKSNLSDLIDSMAASTRSRAANKKGGTVTLSSSDDSGYASGTSTPVLRPQHAHDPVLQQSTSSPDDDRLPREKDEPRIRMSLCFLDERDGRQRMARTARSIAALQRQHHGSKEQDEEDERTTESIRTALDLVAIRQADPAHNDKDDDDDGNDDGGDDIDDELTNGGGDPDLLIVLGGGDQLRLQGFPPWQLRLTEIYHEPSPRRLLTWSKELGLLASWDRNETNRRLQRTRTVLRALALYDHCEMRFGR